MRRSPRRSRTARRLRRTCHLPGPAHLHPRLHRPCGRWRRTRTRRAAPDRTRPPRHHPRSEDRRARTRRRNQPRRPRPRGIPPRRDPHSQPPRTGGDARPRRRFTTPANPKAPANNTPTKATPDSTPPAKPSPPPAAHPRAGSPPSSPNGTAAHRAPGNDSSPRPRQPRTTGLHTPTRPPTRTCPADHGAIDRPRQLRPSVPATGP